jgi:hypothetical protein
MKRNRLVVEYTYSFALIGITSSVKFYKLAWLLNNAMHIDLAKEQDFDLEGKNRSHTYECYSYPSDEPVLVLYKNKSVSTDSEYLLPEKSHFDYILKIPAESQSFSVKEITEVLRDLDRIEYIGALDVDTLKSRDNFLD